MYPEPTGKTPCDRDAEQPQQAGQIPAGIVLLLEAVYIIMSKVI
jgi:hypothetical protein